MRIRFVRLLFISLVAWSVTQGVIRLAGSFTPDYLREKDFISPYLMARAILGGGTPYAPLPDLAARYIQFNNFTQLPHPTPHTPFMGLAFLPFGLLDFKVAALLWLACDLALLATSLLLLRHIVDGLTTRGALLATVCLVGWFPVNQSLWRGATNLLLLVLLLAALLALRKGGEAWAGLALGTVFALKFFAWPIFVYLLIRWRWRVVVVAVAVTVAANLLSVAVLGWDCVSAYYLKVGPEVTQFYRTREYNLSAWTFGQRFFGGFGFYLHAPPFYRSDLLAAWTTYLAVGGLSLTGIWLALRACSIEIAFCLLLITSILISPVTWSHYFAITILPGAVVIDRLQALNWLRALTRQAVITAALLCVPASWLIPLAITMQIGHTAEGAAIIPAWAGLITLAPVAGLLSLAWLVWRLDRAAGGARACQSKQVSAVAPLNTDQSLVVDGVESTDGVVLNAAPLPAPIKDRAPDS